MQLRGDGEVALADIVAAYLRRKNNMLTHVCETTDARCLTTVLQEARFEYSMGFFLVEDGVVVNVGEDFAFARHARLFLRERIRQLKLDLERTEKRLVLIAPETRQRITEF